MIYLERLTQAGFAKFGHVARPGAGVTKAIRDGAVQLSKSPADLSHDDLALDLALDFYEVKPSEAELLISVAERHPHSSQMFIPMNGQRYVVVVWDGDPAVGNVRAFVGEPDDVVIYNPGIWHHGIISLGTTGLFASTMWRTRGGSDVEFQSLATPFKLSLAEVSE